MATIQERNQSFRILFVYQGKRRTVTLGKVSRDEAEVKAGAIDLLLLRIKQKLSAVPAGVSIEDFVLCNGQVRTVEQAITSEPVTFPCFREKYLEAHRDGAMETNGLATVEMHLGHFEETLGEKFPLQNLQLADLQRHVTARRKKKYRGKPLSPVTLKKEMASFRAAWPGQRR